MTAPLRYKSFVTEQIPQSGRGPLPDGSTRMWSPITSTLILGSHDAVLVDPPLTKAQAADVGDWIEASGRQLRAIYITHGHGDHWFGAIPLLNRFPGVAVRATEGTKQQMAGQNTKEFRAEFWDRVFPGQLPSGDVDVDVVGERGFELEGVRLLPVEVGHTDTDATTMLHVPAIGLLVAGDVVYNGIHQYFAETDHEKRMRWMASIEQVEALDPKILVAGHKDPNASDDDPAAIIAGTRAYIRDFERSLDQSHSPQELVDRMMALHGDLGNPHTLWITAQSVFPQ